MPTDNLPNGSATGSNGLTFFGTITASVTHELNNVMGIIEQTVGLLDDLVAGAQSGRPIENEKLLEISGKIARQVDRGAAIIKRLNYFAHTVDEPVRTVELEVLLRNLVDLSQRFATLKNTRLEGEFEQESSVRTNPFVLEQAVFICIRTAIDQAQKGDILTVSFVNDNNDTIITVRGPAMAESEELRERLETARSLMNRLHGTLDFVMEDNRGVFRLQVPDIGDEVAL
jgi:C4-dicarboxylate-specific signal transduction histidine kinase